MQVYITPHMKSLALFGGSFNPAHMGHYAIVQDLLKQGFSKVLIMPAKQNPLKQQERPVCDFVRMQILQAMFHNSKNVSISNWEIVHNKPSYTYNTIKNLKKQYAKYKIYLILGLDAFFLFHKWKNSQYILDNTTLIVYKRLGYIVKEKLSEQVLLLNTTLPDISATQIRQASLEEIEKKAWLHSAALPIWKQHIQETYANTTNT